MFPLVSAELGAVDLVRALNHGLIPDHYLKENYRKSLGGYVRDYLKEEVFAEGLTRNIPAFARFFDAVGYSHGEEINYSSVARDSGVESKTVKEYYQILADTLLGRLVEPFKKRSGRQIITRTPKFYLFDVGVAGFLAKRTILEERGEFFGRALEHLIIMELTAHASYRDLNYEIQYWRTKSGLEVNFVLGRGEVAVEVKGASRLDSADLRPLAAFVDEYSPRKAIAVCQEKEERVVGRIRVMPWRSFLAALWAGQILE
jgi:predicted AAA+ superfamily ATPase